MIIHSFVARVVARLQADLASPGLPGVHFGPALPPSSGQVPRLVVSAGKLDMPAPFGDAPPGQVRPRVFKETLAVNIGAVEGPYTLSQQPMEGTVSCRLAWKQAGDNLEGKKTGLYPRKGNSGNGFTVNYTNKQIRVFGAGALSGTPSLEVEYTYPAIFSIREFRQAMLLESYATTPTEAEKWAALSAAVLVSNTETLLRDSNNFGNSHSGGNYVTEHLVSDFQWMDGNMERLDNNMFRYTLQFRTAGQVILVRAFSDNAEVIRKIYSPGHRNDEGPVSIEARVD